MLFPVKHKLLPPPIPLLPAVAPVYAWGTICLWGYSHPRQEWPTGATAQDGRLSWKKEGR